MRTYLVTGGAGFIPIAGAYLIKGNLKKKK